MIGLCLPSVAIPSFAGGEAISEVGFEVVHVLDGFRTVGPSDSIIDKFCHRPFLFFGRLQRGCEDGPVESDRALDAFVAWEYAVNWHSVLVNYWY